MSTAVADPTAPLTPSGNLRRRRAFSRFTEYSATAAAVFAVAVLGIVVYSVLERGASAISFDFVTQGAPTGFAPAIVGTGVIVTVATLMAAPLGVLVAIFVTEFAGERIARACRLTLDLVNGLPSIIIGVVIFIMLVAHRKQSGFAGSVALAIIMLPLVARGSMEILQLVPKSLREAADALGVSRWRSVLTVILPSARGGIVTATVLAVARAAGETAPLILVSSVADPRVVSINPFEPLANIPVTIFGLSEEANPEGFTHAWGLALILIVSILIANVVARTMLARSRRKMAQ